MKTLILPNYLRWILSTDYVQQLINKKQTGTALPRISNHDLLEIPIPIPDMAGQQEIEKYLEKRKSEFKDLKKEFLEHPKNTMEKISTFLIDGEF